jgi:Zn-dependent peptidase ImmA (M78 family)
MKKEKLKIQILPSVLKTLRENSGFTIEETAKKLGITDIEKMKSAEEVKSSFTINKIKKLAEVYHRPLAAFFSDSAPEVPKSLPDYRFNREKKLTPQVYLAQRRAYYLSSKIAEIGNRKSQIPSLPEHLKAEELANAFKKYLNCEQLKSKKPDEILSYYKNVLEEKLAIAIIEYPLKADDVRAFSTYSDLSVIVINEHDNAQIKLFSLFHEICHLLKRSSGICSIEIEEKGNADIETYCNQFTAEFLVPEVDFKQEINRGKITSFDISSVNYLANIYGVSKQVIMIRLRRFNYINPKQYDEYKKSQEGKEAKKGGFRKRNWDKVFYNRAGNLAIKEVSNSYRKGDISFYEAIDVLNMKSKYVEKFIS